MSYYSQRVKEFTAMVSPAMYGTTLTHNGTSYSCIADPQVEARVMQQAGYEVQRPSRFDMWATDFVASGMKNRDRITDASGNVYELYSVQRDDKEPTVVLRCNRLQ